MVRIITGSAKNIKLKTPDDPQFSAVQEVAKGSLFSIIGEDIKNAQCLDLFSGSGNLGLEALSRGATHCDFVEENKKTTRLIQENINKCGFEETSEIYPKNAVKFAANTEKAYDIIFLDPFYEDTHHIFLMENLEEILNPDGLIAFFHGDRLDINNTIKNTKLKISDQRKFGKSYLTILTH